MPPARSRISARIQSAIRIGMRNWEKVLAALLSLAALLYHYVLQHPSYEDLMIGILGALTALSVGAARDRELTEKLKLSLERLTNSEDLLQDQAKTGVARIFDEAYNFDWCSRFRGARSICVSALRPDGMTDERQYSDVFLDVLNRGGSVTLVISDPTSPALWLRYKEEPSLSYGGTLSLADTLSNLLPEMVGQIRRLYSWRMELVKKGVNMDRFTIKLSRHYPTQAFYKIDNSLYAYSYPYRTRGFHSPMVLFTDPSTPAYQVYDKSLAAIVADAVELTETRMTQIVRMNNNGLLSDEMVDKSILKIVQPRANRGRPAAEAVTDDKSVQAVWDDQDHQDKPFQQIQH